jgi:transposase-like protein
MSKKRTRRSYTPEQKAAILRRHLVDKVPVSDLCDEYEIQPSVFYGWQRQLAENMELALQAGGRRRKADTREAKLASENEALKAKLAKKDSVIAEISEEFVALKKALGEP